MGTRSIIHFMGKFREDFKRWEDNEPLVSIYNQYDGAPCDRGVRLASFLKSLDLVNGFIGDPPNTANGIRCAAARWIAREKKGVGGVYIYPPGSKDVGEDYTYEVYVIGGKLYMYFKGRFFDPKDFIKKYTGWGYPKKNKNTRGKNK